MKLKYRMLITTIIFLIIAIVMNGFTKEASTSWSNYMCGQALYYLGESWYKNI